MTDKKSSDSRRKLLKSIAAGSGAIVAGKSLPQSWSRPVVDSVMLPAHAQTSQICTIDITWEITVTGGSLISPSSYGYRILNHPGGWNEVPPLEVDMSSSVNRTESITLAPGQYRVSAGATAYIADSSGVTANGRTTLSCCSATTQLGQSWSVDQGNQDSGGGDDVLVTIGADGTCQISAIP